MDLWTLIFTRLSVDNPVLALGTVVPFLVAFDIRTVQYVFLQTRMYISYPGQSQQALDHG